MCDFFNFHFYIFRIVVRIDSWEADSMYPNGHFVRSLGAVGDLETEIAAVLVEHNLSVGEFSEGLVRNSVDINHFKQGVQEKKDHCKDEVL